MILFSVLVISLELCSVYGTNTLHVPFIIISIEHLAMVSASFFFLFATLDFKRMK